MRILAAVVWVLVATSTVCAQGRIKADKEMSVDVGDIVQLNIEIDADEVQYRVLGDAAKGFREYDPDARVMRLQILGRSDGYAFVIVWGQKGGKLIPAEVTRAKVGKGAPVIPPIPPPNPPPNPPTPDPLPDDLVALANSIATAAKAEGWSKARMADLALGFQTASRIPKEGMSSEKIFAGANAALKSVLTDPVTAKVQQAYAVELTWVPTDGAHVFTSTEALRLVLAFDRIARACERAAK